MSWIWRLKEEKNCNTIYIHCTMPNFFFIRCLSHQDQQISLLISLQQNGGSHSTTALAVYNFHCSFLSNTDSSLKSCHSLSTHRHNSYPYFAIDSFIFYKRGNMILDLFNPNFLLKFSYRGFSFGC